MSIFIQKHNDAPRLGEADMRAIGRKPLAGAVGAGLWSDIKDAASAVASDFEDDMNAHPLIADALKGAVSGVIFYCGATLFYGMEITSAALAASAGSGATSGVVIGYVKTLI